MTVVLMVFPTAARKVVHWAATKALQRAATTDERKAAARAVHSVVLMVLKTAAKTDYRWAGWKVCTKAGQ